MNELLNIPSLALPRSSNKEAYDAGYDSVINGANTENCNFRYFMSKRAKNEWERGASDARAMIAGGEKDE